MPLSRHGDTRRDTLPMPIWRRRCRYYAMPDAMLRFIAATQARYATPYDMLPRCFIT